MTSSKRAHTHRDIRWLQPPPLSPSETTPGGSCTIGDTHPHPRTPLQEPTHLVFDHEETDTEGHTYPPHATSFINPHSCMQDTTHLPTHLHTYPPIYHRICTCTMRCMMPTYLPTCARLHLHLHPPPIPPSHGPPAHAPPSYLGPHPPVGPPYMGPRVQVGVMRNASIGPPS
jgi:hypothetical protein